MPELSVVIPVMGPPAQYLACLEALARQSMAHNLEVLVVGDESEPNLPLAEAFEEFRYLRLPQLRSRPQAAAIGVLEARSPAVALVEMHAYLDPDWCQRLLPHLTGNCVGVCGRFEVMNPSGSISQAESYVNYGAFLNAKTGPVAALPWHNVIYRTSLLQAQRQDLEFLLHPEERLQAHLRAGGGTFYCDASVAFRHLNTSRVPGLMVYVVLGRARSARRSASWPRWRRIVYASCWPLFIPLMARHTRTPASGTLGVWMSIFVILALIAWGEAVGFLLGPGDESMLTRHELTLSQRLNSRDLALYSR